MSAIVAECRNCDWWILDTGSAPTAMCCCTALFARRRTTETFCCDHFSDDKARAKLQQPRLLHLRDLQDLLNQQHNEATDMIRKITGNSK